MGSPKVRFRRHWLTCALAVARHLFWLGFRTLERPARGQPPPLVDHIVQGTGFDLINGLVAWARFSIAGLFWRFSKPQGQGIHH